jgi:hypothetical protein
MLCTRTSPVSTCIVALLVALGLVACGAEDGTAPPDDPAGPDAEVAADDTFCDAALGLGSPGEPEVDPETATEEEMAAAQQVFAEERLRPIVADLRASGPDAVQDHVATLERALDEADDGDLDAFFGGEGGEARDAIAEEATGRCGWMSLDITTVDYDFEGVPATLDAGPAVISLTNAGDEGHEMIIFRRQDGVDEEWEQIFALDEEEAMQRVEFVAAGFAPAGEESSTAADLDAGDYAMVCFIPVGTDASGTETGDGPPHFEEGMLATFSVR